VWVGACGHACGCAWDCLAMEDFVKAYRPLADSILQEMRDTYRTPPPYARTHAHAHARTHSRAHTLQRRRLKRWHGWAVRWTMRCQAAS
jgi:hypothetical protein